MVTISSAMLAMILSLVAMETIALLQLAETRSLMEAQAKILSGSITIVRRAILLTLPLTQLIAVEPLPMVLAILSLIRAWELLLLLVDMAMTTCGV